METRTRKRRISAAYRYSFARLVLQLWLYYEETIDHLGEASEKELELGRELMGIIRKFLEEIENGDGFEALEQLKSLRDRIIGRVEILAAFSDCFQIYEYVQNRVERRFVVMADSRYTPKELASSLTESLVSIKDPAQRNGKLRDIVAQLPVRFTKSKFYSMVMERLSSYAGLDRGNVEGYLNMLKSSVMLKLPEGMEREEELYGWLECLRRTDYRNLDEEGFEKCRDSLEKGTRLLTSKTDYYVSVEQMANDLYVLFLTEREKIVDASEDLNFRKNTRKILDAIDGGDGELMKENEILQQMEGIQESAADLVMAGGTHKDEILDKVDRLVSGSLFMSVEEEEVHSQEANRQWIDAQARDLCGELDSLFAGMQKAVVRAIMAKVLSGLPMVFQDRLEVEEYIRTSLESCTDFAEREASMELLEQELTVQE